MSKPNDRNYYIGLMSGTSMDAIDAALVEFNPQPNLIAHYSLPLQDETKYLLRQLTTIQNPLEELGKLDVKLGNRFADAANQLITQTGIDKQQIKAIGSHGQNIYHRPDLNFTLQIADPNIIAEKTGITTVADFRRKDVALGGQGAPLTPAFHEFCFKQQAPCAIVNIGGIVNMTALTAEKIIGFDCGPGNTLLDAFAKKYLNKAFDDNGDWARQGKINQQLLNALLQDPYFKQAPPKSTGFEYFNIDWLAKFINDEKPVDIQATLTELTAITISDSVKHYVDNCQGIYICGGGVHNDFLIKRIKTHCQTIPVSSTASIGVDPNWLEAIAFAWFAKRTLAKQTSSLPDITGASRAAILGGIYLP